MTELNENDFLQKELLTQMVAGSEKAFSQLFHLYRNKLYSFIYTISGSKQLAEDTVQEVFLKIWEKRSEVMSIHHFDSYVFRMARNHALNAFKRMSKETFIVEELGMYAVEAPETFNDLEFKQLEQSVKVAIEKLPSKQKQVFILSREHGIRQAEISRLLNITVPTVKSHITQAVHFIRKECRNINPLIKFIVVLVTSFFK